MPRKRAATPDPINGMTPVRLSPNLWLPCDVCGKKDVFMWYRLMGTDETGKPKSVARCVTCAGKP